MPLKSFSFAVPELTHTAQDICDVTGADEKFLRNKVGLEQRHVLPLEMTGTELSADACRALFSKNPELCNFIDLLVVVTQTPDRRIPQNSAMLAAKLDLPNNLASFDISLGCSGYVYAVSIVEGFLQSSGMENAVLVTCDPYTRIIDPADKATNCIFGDAATATWISRSAPGGKIIASDFGTDGSMGDAIMIPAGGAALSPTGVLGGHEISRSELSLQMNGRAVFNFVNSRIPESVRTCLEKAQMETSDVDWYAFHQGSTYMLQAMAQRVGLEDHRVLKNMSRFGNTVSSSIPLLLYDLQEAGSLEGKTILMSGFGVGLSWATSIVKF